MPFRTFAEQACVGSIAFAGACNRRFQHGMFVIQTQFDAVGAQAADVYGQAVFAVERGIDALVFCFSLREKLARSHNKITRHIRQKFAPPKDIDNIHGNRNILQTRVSCFPKIFCPANLGLTGTI